MSVHDAPSIAQIVEAVREWLERDVMTSTEGRLQFHTRVAVNMLSMVERELAVGAEQEAAQSDRLAQLGVADDAELARKIRAGDLDDRLDEVRAFVASTVQAKLEVANPRHLEGPRPPAD